MANRSYLYSLSNQPKSYSDRPDTISGLSEWPYNIPFTYRVLMSGDPKLCASLVSDGFDDDSPDNKTQLYAISSDFAPGFARLKKFIEVLRVIGKEIPDLHDSMLDEILEFLEEHKDSYLLLETIELDCMDESEEAVLRGYVEGEISACREAGAAIDVLPEDPEVSADIIINAAKNKSEAAPNAFCGLEFNDKFDDIESELPLGLYWSDILYYELENKEEFEEAL
ncbi:hypothetical protein [Microbulbifer sp. GL-2]|uniref:DUF7822 domain-containing protein n=1 Tax=Microbulbifer sp. GL-2 TaxID=2591606 RepID=UPI001162B05B|nr:hypothetical protein [Microbulbifer sp. GL-2]BBM00184.1 hypothetical protein GL2_02580 [Microbulbifer sp. GL-2]